MNFYKIYMFNIPYGHVSVNAHCKFSSVCVQNFICTQDKLGSLMENGSVLHLTKAYCCVKHFRKKNDDINI